MLVVECPTCAKNCTVDERYSGCTVSCAHCQRPFTIATMPRQELLPSPTPPPQDRSVVINVNPPPKRSKPRDVFKETFASSSGSLSGVAVVCGAAFLLLMLVCGGFRLMAWRSQLADEEIISSIDNAIIAEAKSVLVKHGYTGKLSRDTRVDRTGNRWGASHFVSGSVMHHRVVRHFSVGFEITHFDGKSVYLTKWVQVDEMFLE